MRRTIALLAIMSLSILLPSAADDAPPADATPSVVLAAMAEGVGDLSYLSLEWVDAAREALNAEVAKHADALKDFGKFTFCEVAHNPPAYLHVGAKVAWHIIFDGATVEVGTGELPDDECDLKVESDHSILSNLGHIQHHGKDPNVVAAAQERLRKVARWRVKGSSPDNPAFKAIVRSVHDTMAARTIPRFVWMSPEWVEVARYIVSIRAKEFADGIRDVEYTFNEVFTDAPAFAFPDGPNSGFWVHCSFGEVTVGYGAVPEELSPPDYLNQLLYTPVVPVGRTVVPNMTAADKEEQTAYLATAFSVDTGEGNPPVKQSTPEQKKPMPDGLKIVMGVLHDELSKRSSGELPSDYDKSVRAEWAAHQAFDRDPGYDASWLLYDQFDIYGNPR
jgi:hypothetical protein